MIAVDGMEFHVSGLAEEGEKRAVIWLQPITTNISKFWCCSTDIFIKSLIN